MVKASLGVSAVGYFVNILFLRRVRVGGLVAVQQSQDIFNCRMLWKKYHQNRHSGDGMSCREFYPADGYTN